jgi:predicted nucleotidyltransferase
LKDRGLVRHREPYWALTDDRHRALGFLSEHTVAVGPDGRTDASGGDHRTSPVDSPDGIDLGGRSGDSAPDHREDSSLDASALERVPDSHREAAREFFDRVDEHLRGSAEALSLFGSVARTTASPDSDVDVLAVVADGAEFSRVDDPLLDVGYEGQLEFGVRIEVHSMRAREFATKRDRGDPFVHTVLEEGMTDV